MWLFPYGELCEGARGNLVLALDADADVIDRSSSIAAGVEAAGDCGTRTVVVCPGRYDEAVMVRNFGRLDLEIVAPGGPAVTVIDGWTARARATLEFDASTVQSPDGPSYELNVAVRGLGVTGGWYGISMGDTPSGFEFPATLVLDGVRVYGNTTGVDVDLLSNGSNVRVVDSEIFANSAYGLSLFATSPTDLAGTWIHDNAGSGVMAGTDLVGGVIERNGFGGFSSGGGINSWGATTVTGTVIRFNRGRDGGGIFGFLTLRDVWVEGNSAERGGGLFGSFDLVGATVVTQNHADRDGGGVWAWGLRGEGISPITYNTAAAGGGVFVGGGADVTGVWIADNSAKVGGGLLAEGKVTLESSLVLDNEADRGGGIAVVDPSVGPLSDATLDGVVVERNRADEEGGGILVGQSASVTARAVEIVGNTAAIGGGAFIEGDSGWLPARLDLRNGRVVENSAVEGGGVAIRGTDGELWSSNVDWGSSKTGEDNWPEDLDVNGARYDGDDWDTFGCNTFHCVEEQPPLAP